MSESTHPIYKILCSLFVIGLLIYGIFNTRFLIKGPEIVLAEISKDSDIIKSDSPSFTLTGKAIHSSFFTVNERPVVIDEQGNFKEKFLLFDDAVNTITLHAKDKFGKEIRKELKVVYTGTPDSLAVATNIFNITEEEVLEEITVTTTEEGVEAINQEETSEDIIEGTDEEEVLVE